MIRIEILAEMVLAVAGMSPHGSKIERTRMVLQLQEIAIAMVINLPIAKVDGETRNVMIEEIEVGTGEEQTG